MSVERKRPGAGFWATVAIVLMLVGYPLSYPPVVRLANRGFFPEAFEPAIDLFDRPMTWFLYKAPDNKLKDLMFWYLRLWSDLIPHPDGFR
jgi:hypothetical protein